MKYIFSIKKKRINKRSKEKGKKEKNVEKGKKVGKGKKKVVKKSDDNYSLCRLQRNIFFCDRIFKIFDSNARFFLIVDE